jgi:hypothetical protein
MRIAWAGLSLAALTLASCSAPPPAPPRPAAPPAPPPTIAPPQTAATDWRDIPETPGSWKYARDAGGSAATFTETGGVADLVLRCDSAARAITLTRPGTTGAITVTTSYGAKTWSASPVALAAADPLLDQIAFTRGRFTVDGGGLKQLVLPAWAEPARVIEDCRG